MTETGRYVRRAALRASVFGADDHEPWTSLPDHGASVASGVITDLRDGVLVLDGPRGPSYLTTSPATGAWLGARVALSALRPGDPVIVRCGIPDGDPRAPRIAERVWARIGRAAGTIVAADGPELLVDPGRSRPPQRVVVAASAERQIQVRFPRLAVGYLVDVIGTRHDDHLLAVAPATAQPPYRADRRPGAPLVSDPLPAPVSGSAVWHEPAGGEPEGLLGLAYPALDEGAGEDVGCLRLPLLSLGSAVRIRNECSGRAAVLPVTGDGVLARQFCDRCVTCGTSPKGRLADLTIAAFVELGGNLEKGCFNATAMFPN